MQKAWNLCTARKAHTQHMHDSQSGSHLEYLSCRNVGSRRVHSNCDNSEFCNLYRDAGVRPTINEKHKYKPTYRCMQGTLHSPLVRQVHFLPKKTQWNGAIATRFLIAYRTVYIGELGGKTCTFLEYQPNEIKKHTLKEYNQPSLSCLWIVFAPAESMRDVSASEIWGIS